MRIVCWSITAALSFAGLLLATYLSVAYLSGAGVACGVSGGCGAVTASEYARFLGVPVALLGVGGYAILMMGSLAALGLGQPPAALRWSLAAIAAIGFTFSAYLTATQALIIGSYCVYCLTSAALMTAITALTITAAVRKSGVGCKSAQAEQSIYERNHDQQPQTDERNHKPQGNDEQEAVERQ